MADQRGMTRREVLGAMGKAAAVTVIAIPTITALGGGLTVSAETLPLAADAGIDRAVMLHGKTYLSAWGGYGARPVPGRPSRGAAPPADTPLPAPALAWRKVSGPGDVTFVDPSAAVTTATFSKTGDYVLEVVANAGSSSATSSVNVTVELPPPATPLTPILMAPHTISSPLWKARTKALITSWIPHCVDQINRADIPAGQGDGGIDNFVEAAKAQRGEPYAPHKGYVFSNAWVHQTVEAMSLALMVDAEGDKDILAAQDKMRATLDDWIPKILAARSRTAICRPRSRCATRRGPRRPPAPTAAARSIRTRRLGRSGRIRGRPNIGATTRATPAAISSSRRSITTR